MDERRDILVAAIKDHDEYMMRQRVRFDKREFRQRVQWLNKGIDSETSQIQKGRDIVEAGRERLYGKRAVELRKADEPAMALRNAVSKRPKLIGDEGTQLRFRWSSGRQWLNWATVLTNAVREGVWVCLCVWMMSQRPQLRLSCG